MADLASLASRPAKCKLRSTRVNSPEITKKIEGLVCVYTYLSRGYFSLVRFTDMTKLLSFFIFVDRVEVLVLLLVFTDPIGLLILVKFTDMTKLLRFFISEDRVDVLRLFVLAFEAVLVTFTDFVVLIISFDAIALSANAPTEITKSIENSIIPEISAYFIFVTC
jgi:hypothetical protein